MVSFSYYLHFRVEIHSFYNCLVDSKEGRIDYGVEIGMTQHIKNELSHMR